MRIGTRVTHNGHGLGTIVGRNQNRPYNPSYLGRPGDGISSVILQLSLSMLYDNIRYPYIVRFDSGYQDVYGPESLRRV